MDTDLLVKPIDPNVDPSFFLDMNWYNQTKLPGFSFMIRAKNEASNIGRNLISIMKHLDKDIPYELIIINNDSQDETGNIAESLINLERGDRVISYPYRVAKPGLENYYTPVDSIHSFIYFTQFCLMKCRREFCFRWDADFEMTEKLGRWLKMIWEDHQLKQKYHCITFGYFMMPATDQDKITNSELYLFQTRKDPYYYRLQIWEQIGFLNSESYLFGNPSVDEALILHQSTLNVVKSSYLELPWWITKLQQSSTLGLPQTYIELLNEIEAKCQAFKATIPKDAQTYCRSMDPKPVEVVNQLPFAETFSQVHKVLTQMRQQKPLIK